MRVLVRFALSLPLSQSQMYILRSGGRTDIDKNNSRTTWQGNDDSLQRIQEKGTVNNEGYVNIGAHLGLASQRGKFTPYRSFLSPVTYLRLLGLRHLNLFLLVWQPQPPPKKDIRRLLR